MGTSLSGLTPATTFDGLLKTSDNEPLDGTLKAISTGDGTDTILQLSDSALSIGGDTSIGSSDNTSGSNALVVQNSDGTQLLAVRNDGRLLLGTSSNLMYLDGALLQTWQINNTYLNAQKVGIGVNASGNYPLHIKGSGATSATTSLLVQNSAGSELFKVQDDGRVDFGSLFASGTNIYGTNSSFRINIAEANEYQTYDSHIFKTYDGSAYSEAMRITGANDQLVGIGETTPTARLHIKGSGNDATTTALLVQNSDGTDALKVTDDGIVKLGTTGQEGRINLCRSSNGGNVGIIRAIGNGLYLTNGSETNQILISNSAAQGIAIGSGNISMNATLGIKGSGATSATTALLVENSAGTELMKVEDGGKIKLGSSSSIVEMNSGYNNRFQQNRLSFYSTNTNIRGINAGGQGLIVSKNTGTTDLYPSAILAVDSTTQGFLPPRMTTTERDAITTPAAGLMVYNTTTNKAQCYNGTTWNDLF